MRGYVVLLDDEIADFLCRPLMCILAGVDSAGRPSAGRGVGLHILPGREAIDVTFSAWQWPRLESTIDATGRAAVTFVSPADYVTYQIKGRATLRDADAGDLERAGCFITDATDALASLGVPPGIIPQWLTSRQARVARIRVDEIYIQTPGPRAGMRAGAKLA